MSQPNNCNHFTGKKRPAQSRKRKKREKEKRVHVNKYQVAGRR